MADNESEKLKSTEPLEKCFEKPVELSKATLKTFYVSGHVHH